MADQPTSTVKAKRVMTPEALASLAAAREKAAAKRREIGDVTRKAKALKELDLASKKEQVQKDIAAAVQKKPAKHAAPSSSSSSESDDDDEPPPPPRPAKGARKARPKARAAPHPPPPPPNNAALTAAVARQELQRRIMADNFRTAYASMFGVAPPDYMTM